MSASEQLVRIGNGAKLHLLASYLIHQPRDGSGIHGRATCGAKGQVTHRCDLSYDELERLTACARCTETATRAAEWLVDHERIFHGEVRRG